LQPLEPLRDRSLDSARRVDKIRGDGDNHMRDRLFATDRAVSRQHPGRLGHPGWLGQRLVDRPEIKSYLQAKDATRTRFGSLEFGVLVPERADPGRAWSHDGPNKPVAPVNRSVSDVARAQTATGRT